MRIFAISDLHLPGGGTKAMDVFGPHWAGHFEKIRQDWSARVADEDVVLLPGDFSWAMRLADALPDLNALGMLPGRKVLLKGNHDYWWSALGQLRAALPRGMYAVQNDAVVICETDRPVIREGDKNAGQDESVEASRGLAQVAIAGSRGWSYPDPNAPTYIEDDKIYKRELIRLSLSIQDAKRRAPSAPLIVMTHFPPFRERYEPSPMTDIIGQSGAVAAVYGHLHGESGFAVGAARRLGGVTYHLVSCDGLGFQLKELSINQETS